MVVSTNEQPKTSALTREQIPAALRALDLVGQYYPANRIPVKTQYLVEGLFDEGKI